MNIVKNIKSFAKKLAVDVRGEDLVEASSNLSRGGKVVIAAVVIAAAGGGATTLVNNSNKASDKTSHDINSAVGAGTSTTQTASTPFQIK